MSVHRQQKILTLPSGRQVVRDTHKAREWKEALREAALPIEELHSLRDKSLEIDNIIELLLAELAYMGESVDREYEGAVRASYKFGHQPPEADYKNLKWALEPISDIIKHCESALDWSARFRRNLKWAEERDLSAPFYHESDRYGLAFLSHSVMIHFLEDGDVKIRAWLDECLDRVEALRSKNSFRIAHFYNRALNQMITYEIIEAAEDIGNKLKEIYEECERLRAERRLIAFDRRPVEVAK